MTLSPWISGLLATVAATVALEVNALDQSVSLQSSNAVAPAESLSAPLLGSRFNSAFNNRANDVFADQLQSINVVQWSVESRSGDPEVFRQRTTTTARHAFARTVEYSLRDTVVNLPLLQWLGNRQEWLADLLRDSVDNVGEESVAPLNVSHGLVEQSWWKELSKERQLHYGIRPLGTSPYTYVSFGVRDRDNLVLLGNLRYYYDHFADHRFEFALSAPLEYGFSLGIGTSYQFGRHEQEKRVGIKLFKELNRGGIVHIGFEVREHPFFVAGLTVPW